jgi:hypothetical protein
LAANEKIARTRGLFFCSVFLPADYLAGGTMTTVSPVRPRCPFAPSTPVAPVLPVAPVSPVFPVAPVVPVFPVAPVSPVAPVAPFSACAPVAPVAPGGPAGPGTVITETGAAGVTTAGRSHALSASAAITAENTIEYLMMIPLVVVIRTAREIAGSRSTIQVRSYAPVVSVRSRALDGISPV